MFDKLMPHLKTLSAQATMARMVQDMVLSLELTPLILSALAKDSTPAPIMLPMTTAIAVCGLNFTSRMGRNCWTRAKM